MFAEMNATEAVQMIGAVFVIGTAAVLGLVLLSILAPERLLATSEQMTAPTFDDYAAPASNPAHFREPADLDEVDARARWFARAAVIHSPAPVREPALDVATAVPYRLAPGALIDELMSVSPAMFFNSSGARTSVNPSSRYYRASVDEIRPRSPRAVSAAPAPAGRHRAPEHALALTAA